MVFFVPTLSRLSGGLALIYKMAALLHEMGHQVFLCYMGRALPAGLKESRLPILPWDEPGLERRDIWWVPESWPNALAPGLRAGCRTIVYAQNWIFMLGGLPEGVTWGSLPVEYIAVSRPVRWFMEEVLRLPVLAELPPALEDCFFAAPEIAPHEHTAKRRKVRVAWMPRKNKALAERIQLLALESLHGEVEVEWAALRDLTPGEVASQLRASDIFLCSSLAEGFGLPPLEAMACGCVPVGFAGVGGWEYMRGSPLSFCNYTPCLPLGGERPWGDNGFFVSDGDVFSAGLALAQAIRLAWDSPQEWKELQRQGVLAASNYNLEAMRGRLAALFGGAGA